MEVTTREIERFDVEDPAAFKHLDEHGFVVIRDAAPAEDIETAKRLFWSFLCGTGLGIARDDPDTWNNWPGWTKTGIISGYGVGQARFMWHLRTLPRVLRAFELCWGTDELITSFDGCGVFRPWSFEPSWKTEGGWFHVDQGKKKLGKHAVQGLVSLMDATPSTGGLVVIPGSHRYHTKVVMRNRGSGDFVRMKPDDPVLSTAQPLLVTCKAGDLVLWDSRTVHCNTPALEDTAAEEDEAEAEEKEKREKEREQEEDDGQDKGDAEDESKTASKDAAVDLIRIVAYICMTPKSMAKEGVLEKRREAFKARVTTSHWPHEFHPGWSAAPTCKKIKPTPLINKLIG